MVINIDLFNKFKCIVFDFDGVIVDSNSIKKDAFFSIWKNELSKEHIELIKKIISYGRDRFEIIPTIYNILKNEYMLEKSYKYYLNEYNITVKNKIIKTGVRNKILKMLKQNSDKILLINSATPEKQLLVIINQLKLDKYINEVKGRPSNKFENFNYFIRKYSLNKKDIIYIGDSKIDYITAKKIGIKFIAVISKGSDFNNYSDLDIFFED